ncbi:carotenoid ester lipase precursor [Obba rivulosa]|uniref:Carotenoid ester lipase n=1 Tax=Obba rivulosa TaxID=1052685 RepID=A0A8E2DNA8_9APHY|nr:carotenoid ester lipase precursor [Obba rivulosa]
MFGLRSLTLFILTGLSSSLASILRAQGSPFVILDKGIFAGKSINHTDQYLGIPYAQPPVGDLRFRLPVAAGPYDGFYNATMFGDVCPQDGDSLIAASGAAYLEPFEALFYETFPTPNITQSEDCLSLNVYVPAGTKPGANLPVVMWLSPASFLFGGGPFFDGAVIVEHSVKINQPVILVSINYRLNAFGFLPGREAKDAGITNLGLRDQRQALRWIQQYIFGFGGDKRRVTVWGANSGSISAGFQMLNNGGDSEGLFSGAWMQSGIPLPLNTYSDLQGTYDILVNKTSCQGSSDSLDCLRKIPFDELYEAMLSAPAAERFGRWQIVLDYDFIAQQPETLLSQGKVARVPFIISCTDDEGTLGALNLTSITTDNGTATWIMDEGLPGVSMEQVEQIFALYPSDPAAGSPFDTGDLYAITPQYKRLAAIIGDIEYHSQRRFFLNHTSGQQNAWSYLSKQFKIPYVGSVDLSDLLNIWGPGDLTDRLINFVATGNPNHGSGVYWPQWTISAPHQLNIHNDSSFTVEDDDFRAEGIELLMALNIQHPE